VAQTDKDRAEKASIGIAFGTGHTVSGYSMVTGTEAGRNIAENTRCTMGIGIAGGSQVLYATNVIATSPADAEAKRIANGAGIAGGSQSRYGT
jgi:hypothetical protein